MWSMNELQKELEQIQAQTDDLGEIFAALTRYDIDFFKATHEEQNEILNAILKETSAYINKLPPVPTQHSKRMIPAGMIEKVKLISELEKQIVKLQSKPHNQIKKNCVNFEEARKIFLVKQRYAMIKQLVAPKMAKLGSAYWIERRYQGNHEELNEWFENAHLEKNEVISFNEMKNKLNEPQQGRNSRIVYFENKDALKTTTSEGKVLMPNSHGVLETISNDNKVSTAGFLPDAKGSIYVMDVMGQLYISLEEQNTKGLVHHSSLLKGDNVICAGKIVVKNGEIIEISNESGHYKPSAQNLLRALEKLSASGINIDNIIVYNVINGAKVKAPEFIRKKGVDMPRDMNALYEHCMALSNSEDCLVRVSGAIKRVRESFDLCARYHDEALFSYAIKLLQGEFVIRMDGYQGEAAINSRTRENRSKQIIKHKMKAFQLLAILKERNPQMGAELELAMNSTCNLEEMTLETELQFEEAVRQEEAANELRKALDSGHILDLKKCVVKNTFDGQEQDCIEKLAEIKKEIKAGQNLPRHNHYNQIALLTLASIPMSFNKRVKKIIDGVAKDPASTTLSPLKIGMWQRYIADNDGPFLSQIRNAYLFSEKAYYQLVEVINSSFSDLYDQQKANKLSLNAIQELASLLNAVEMTLSEQLQVIDNLKNAYIKWLKNKKRVKNLSRLNEEVEKWETELCLVRYSCVSIIRQDIKQFRTTIENYYQKDEKSTQNDRYSFPGEFSIQYENEKKKLSCRAEADLVESMTQVSIKGIHTAFYV